MVRSFLQPHPYGNNKLLEASLVQLQQKTQLGTGVEKLRQNLKQLLFREFAGLRDTHDMCHAPRRLTYLPHISRGWSFLSLHDVEFDPVAFR